MNVPSEQILRASSLPANSLQQSLAPPALSATVGLLPEVFFPTRCRCCGGTDLHPYFNLGMQPLANDLDQDRLRFPLEAAVCSDCFHSQLTTVISPKLLYGHYCYVSGVSLTFRNHCRQLAADVLRQVAQPAPAVLDIGANDGTLLSCFRDLGCRTLGVDPAANLEAVAAEGITVLREFWSRDLARQLNQKFDIITGTNVFAHVHDCADFLAGCAECLQEDGVVVLEFPYGAKLITAGLCDTVYHEHLSYFLVNSLVRLAENNGFYVYDLQEHAMHCGSLRVYLKQGSGPHHAAVSRLIEAERTQRLFELATYTQFAVDAERTRKEFADLVRTLQRSGERVVGYGASAKGITMLNYSGVDLDYIVDDTPLKQGKRIPGRRTPIFPAQRLVRETGPLNLVILSWNFLTEIVERIRALRPSGRDHVILYVPDVERRPV